MASAPTERAPDPALDAHLRRTAEQPAPRLLGLGETDREAGRVELSCPSTALGSDGAPAAGVLCMLADHAIGAKVNPIVTPRLQSMLTSHLHLELLRPLTRETRHLVGQQRDVDVARSSAFATATASAADGRSIARISGRFVLVDGLGAPDPNGRPEVSDFAPNGFEWHPLTDAPVYALLGTRALRAESGRVRFALAADPRFANNNHALHGGISGLIGERACELALRSLHGADPRFRLVELRVVYLRGVEADGALLDVEGDVVHAGRTQASLRARVHRADGKLAVQVEAVASVERE